MKCCISRCLVERGAVLRGIIACVTSTLTSTTSIDDDSLRSRLAAREERIELLEEENRWLKSQLFGRSSEKTPIEQISSDQGSLFNEAEALAALAEDAPLSLTIPAHERGKGGRKKLSADLPRIEVIHDLLEEQKVCATDGTRLERIGEEVSEQLDYQPARVRVIRNVRPKYACPCCKIGVTIAPVRAQLLPKSLATPALLAHITTAKFVDGTPLYRQEPQFARLGVSLGRATMAGWMIKLGAIYVVPLINLLHELMLLDPLIHCDETRLQVLKSDKSPTSDHWMWVRASGPPGQRIILFDYDASRAGAVPKRLLGGYRGILLTDGYEAYESTARGLDLVHAGCMAHARRKFDEARKAKSPDAADSRAKIALDFIRGLYEVERALWDKDQPISPDHRVRVRSQLSAPIMARLRAWLEALAPQVLPQSLLGKAVHYTLRQWQKLSAFLAHGEVPLDNNRCENAIRPFVVGRKGWLFSDTVKGAVASANLYSLVETAKANGVEPHAYLSLVFARLPTAQTVEDFEALLPWRLKAEIATAR
jgi:transposase